MNSFSILVSPFDYKGGVFPGVGGTCVSSGSLSPGATCTVVVSYAPIANGFLSDSVSVSYNDGVTTQNTSRTITGTGFVPSVLAITDGSTYDFGTPVIGTSADHTFTLSVDVSSGVSATGLTPIALSAPYSFKGGTFPGTGGNCSAGGSIAPGASCTVVVSFTPSVVTPSGSSLSFNYHDGVENQNSARPDHGCRSASGSPDYFWNRNPRLRFHFRRQLFTSNFYSHRIWRWHHDRDYGGKSQCALLL